MRAKCRLPNRGENVMKKLNTIFDRKECAFGLIIWGVVALISFALALSLLFWAEGNPPFLWIMEVIQMTGVSHDTPVIILYKIHKSSLPKATSFC